MTERELLALMAASIWPHLDDQNSVLTEDQRAVMHARRILEEVDISLRSDPRSGS